MVMLAGRVTTPGFSVDGESDSGDSLFPNLCRAKTKIKIPNASFKGGVTTLIGNSIVAIQFVG